jgi:hypothetical protein
MRWQIPLSLFARFVEDYHEKLEEDYLFPLSRFREANRLVELVDTLNSQHQKERILTDRTITTGISLRFEGCRSTREAEGVCWLFSFACTNRTKPRR